MTENECDAEEHEIPWNDAGGAGGDSEVCATSTTLVWSGHVAQGSSPAEASAHGVLDIQGSPSEWTSDTGCHILGVVGPTYDDSITSSSGCELFSLQYDMPNPGIGIRSVRDAS